MNRAKLFPQSPLKTYSGRKTSVQLRSPNDNTELNDAKDGAVSPVSSMNKKIKPDEVRGFSSRKSRRLTSALIEPSVNTRRFGRTNRGKLVPQVDLSWVGSLMADNIYGLGIGRLHSAFNQSDPLLKALQDLQKRQSTKAKVSPSELQRGENSVAMGRTDTTFRKRGAFTR